MDLNEYQAQAIKFAKYSESEYPFLALGEEVGEVMGKLAKFIRKNGGNLSSVLDDISYPDIELNSDHFELRMQVKKELGDVLWQLQACCNELGFTLEEVALNNIDKLSGRESRGTIVGEGDSR